MSILIDSYNKLFKWFGSTSLHNGKDMLFYPKIKKRKAKKLKDLYQLENDETILFARNCKLRSSFKKGLVITDRTLRLRATNIDRAVTVRWSNVICTNYDSHRRCITIDYLLDQNSTSLNIPMKFFLKKKKFYDVGADSIFLPLIDTLAYTTRATHANTSEGEILDNIISIPDNIDIDRTKATNWFLIIFTAIGSLLLLIFLSQNKSKSKSKHSAKNPSANAVPNLASGVGTSSKLLNTPAVLKGNSALPNTKPVEMRRPKYERLPNGQCKVTDVLGFTNTYPSCEMAINLTNFLTGFPVTFSSSFSSSSSRSSSSGSSVKPDPQTEYMMRKNAEVDKLTSSRDDAVRKYREAKSRNDTREMSRWATAAHDAQGAINVKLPGYNSIDRSVRGIDF